MILRKMDKDDKDDKDDKENYYVFNGSVWPRESWLYEQQIME